MNIQNKLIFLHFPKTAGRYITDMLITHNNVERLENIREKPLMPMAHFKWSDISNNVNNNQIPKCCFIASNSDFNVATSVFNSAISALSACCILSIS